MLFRNDYLSTYLSILSPLLMLQIKIKIKKHKFSFQFTIAHCMDLAQKSQKIVSKSCFNYTFSMILTCEAVFVDNKSAVQV